MRRERERESNNKMYITFINNINTINNNNNNIIIIIIIIIATDIYCRGLPRCSSPLKTRQLL